MAERPAIPLHERRMIQRARPRMVARLVMLHGEGLTLMLGVPAIVALLGGLWQPALCLAIASAATIALACLRGPRAAVPEPRQIEALVSVALAFLLGAALATPAFIAMGLAPADAVFEAVSGLTTTGLSVAPGVVELPLAGQFLRFWLQWAGGFAFAATAIALVVGPGAVAMRLGRIEGPGATLLGSAQSRARYVLAAYLCLTALAVVGAALAARDPLAGAVTALAAVSTGGFALGADSLAGATPGLQGVLTLAMMAGAISMTLYVSAWQQGRRRSLRTALAHAARDFELRSLLLIAALASAAVIAVEAARPGGIGIWDSAFTVLSAQSTAGFSTVDVSTHAPAALALLIVVMGIGGSLGSTAGGVKVFRAAYAFAAMRLVLLRAALGPRTVSHLRVAGKRVDTDEGTAIFALFAFYLIALLGLWFGFLIAGFPALPSLFDTVSALSTVGLSAGAVGPEMPTALKAGVIAAMLLGRLEFLAFIALVSPRTWTS
ncbi:TrkH family potassium uptake protein [Rhodobacteraceae bacterium NNCM2]|nr:TrkH family potassium uptake protein [Coraliihabitans acroporae]